MTDQELLERAARALGDTLHINSEGRPVVKGRYWNPLRRDDDAFRLLHSTQADLHYGENDLGETIVTIQPFNVPFSECPWCEAYDIEGLRRAIVRAAAAMVEDT